MQYQEVGSGNILRNHSPNTGGCLKSGYKINIMLKWHAEF